MLYINDVYIKYETVTLIYIILLCCITHLIDFTEFLMIFDLAIKYAINNGVLFSFYELKMCQ